MSDPSLSNDPGVENVDSMNKSPLHTINMLLSTLLLVVWCIAMLAVHAIWKLLHVPKIEKCYFVFHAGCCRLFNLRCEIKGEISTARPTLFLSNHISYLDVFVLGRYVPGFFIAKSEVAGWPILGWLAKAQNTLFFERSSKKVRHQMNIMSEHFNKKGNLILFPEGTSTNGEYVVPFKSSLLQSVESSSEEVYIQPISLAYTDYKNTAMTRDIRDQYAWYATMPFASHFFNVLGMGRATVVITFHKPVMLSEFESRKACAQYCHTQVAAGLEKALP
jgi:1-acyl-sn-glycerol-3-phosphate acyltransferase